MPNRENYDFSYRPQSYWGPQELKSYYGSRIKGELRREAALKDIDVGICRSAYYRPSYISSGKCV